MSDQAREMIENTSQRDPAAHSLGVLSEGSDSYITGMEAQGQRDLLRSSQMPTKGPWDDLEALGFSPGDIVPGDDLFRFAALPDGWKREGSDHAMWSYILDGRGVQRVAIFYKAAFYDRKAFCRIVDVGSDVASRLIYGDDVVALPSFWEALSVDERAAALDFANDYLERAREHPEIYERAPRAERLIILAADD